MTKRKPEDDVQAASNCKDRRINYIVIPDVPLLAKAKAALEKGCFYVKLCIESTKGSSLWLKPKEINVTFGPLTQKDDTLFLNKNRKLILVTKSLTTIEEVAKYVLSVPEANVRIIDSNIVSKYIVRDIDTDYSLEEIISDFKSQDILVSKVVRFKRKGSSDPIPIILIDEIGKTNRKDIKIGRMIFKVNKFIENPKVCFKCLRFGHTQLRCDKAKRCSNCGELHEDNCLNPTKCFRCGEAHHALDPKCKFYILEKQIINLVRDEDISFFEARKRVASQPSYASSVGATPSSSGGLSPAKSQFEELNSAILKLSEQVSALLPLFHQVENLREVNQQCIVRCAEIQGQLLNQVQENKQLKELTESQRSHIEFLQKQISLSDPSFQLHPVPSSELGLVSPPLVSFSEVGELSSTDFGSGID
ncbi:hypothetical protein AVEN_94869-1 [Araneus ventricosus]|uniref:CCHC-type domain-containing protein n=1 Tax=Araneus ventricosus TaxID=182803 RepID=A0A4Y2AWT6_ARAVE|nr:hypothetical protein AVEN_94869-1 [Araneus ventricosus]